ncbi:hypothetical protein, partial [Enterobacter intestinihominis]
PYPYRRRRRRGDLTFLPGGGGANPATKTHPRPGNATAAGGVKHLMRAEKKVNNILFFKPPLKQIISGKKQKN